MLEQLKKQNQEIQELKAMVEALSKTIAEKDSRIKWFEEQFRLFQLQRYGRKGEKLSKDQLMLFDEEPGVQQEEVDQEAELPESKKKDSRRGKPRISTLSKVPERIRRVEEIIPCQEGDCQCAQCGSAKAVIGYETAEKLDFIPAEFIVRVIKREKRACSACKNAKVQTAPKAPAILEKSLLSNVLTVDVIIRKYSYHQPIYRQRQMIELETGLSLPESTLNGPVLHAGFLCEGLARAMRLELLQGSYIQADETTVQVMDRSQQRKNHLGYIFEYSHPKGNVIFEYQKGRGREGPERFLETFQGVLQTDGYQVYDGLFPEQIQRMACMAHVRRKFHEASQVQSEDPRPVEILVLMRGLYKIEREMREKGMSDEQRRAHRQLHSVPEMKRLKERIEAISREVLNQSALGKACQYALGQWNALETFLEFGEVEIDNNHCERAIRPIAIGRKNWMHIGSHSAAPKIMALNSVLETCKRNNIPAREYLLDVLPGLGDRPQSDLPQLTPLAWKARQVSQSE